MQSSAHARQACDIEEEKMRMAPDLREWTVADLADLPDDGQRYEVIDGELFVTPAPSLRHQDAIAALYLVLAPYVKAHSVRHLVFAPADVTFSPRRGVQPDLFVAAFVNGRRPAKSSDIRTLLLAVEVLSPSSARADRVVKRAMYSDEGVAEYWLIDLEGRHVERSTPAAAAVERAADSIAWHPAGAAAPLLIDLERYFAEVLDG
jgi:Uma2 family endonuclease